MQYSYQVAAVNYDGVEGPLSLGVSVSAAGIASINAPGSTSILVAFTEPVDPVSSQTAGNYQVNGGITVTSAVLEPDGRTVLLTTSAALGTSNHTLTANNIDTAAMSALPVSTGTFTYSAFTVPTTLPGPGYYAPFGPNGTWNYYVPVTTAAIWTLAESYAGSQTFGGKTGNLATIRSATENTFLDTLMGGVEYWTGLTNTGYSGAYDYGAENNNALPATGVAPSATTVPITSITYSGTTATVTTATTTAALGLASGVEVFIAGATPSLYDGSFAVTGTGTYTFTYTMSGTPSANASGTMTVMVPQRGYGFVWVDGEAFTYQNWESGQPNNTSSGATPANYVAAVATAGTWDDRSNSNSSYPYVIEFNLGLASPPDAGSLSVVEVHGSSALTSISGGISLINAPGSATVTNYTSVLTSYFDPEDVAGNQHFTAFPFGGDTSGIDHNFAVEVQGTIQIPAAGTYTFNVNSGDGFQLSIGSQTFTGSSTGTTYGSTMSYTGTRTAADSLGVTTFTAAGTYSMTLYYFDGATDAPRLELSAASGSYTSFSSNFHLVGDTTDGGLSVQNSSGYVPPTFAVTVNPLATNSTSPSISGTCTNTSATLSVRVNGNWYAVTNNSGAWTLPAGEIPALAGGTYSVTVCGVNTSQQTAYDAAVNDLTVATASPTVSITAPASPTLTPVNSIAIQFSEPVENFNLQDLQLSLTVNGVVVSEPLEGATLTTTDDQNWTLGNISGYTSAAGTYTLTFTNAGWGVTDDYGNVLVTGAGASWTESSPAVQSINRTGSACTNASTVQYTVTFNESVTNVLAADFTLATSGAAGTIESVTGSGSTYTVTVNNVSGNGTLGLNLANNGSIIDVSGNPLSNSFTGQLFTIDTVAPTITIGAPSASYAAGGPITYTVTYADANFNASTLAAGNVTLNATGTASGTIGVSGSGLTYTVTISSIHGDGSLGISIGAGTASDLAGNLAPATGPSTTFIVDNTAPTISIGTPSTTITEGGPITYTVTYADANFNASTLAAGNVTLNATGTASGTLAVSGTGLTRTVTISSITGNGSLGISIGAGTASDLAGNLAPAAGPSTTFIVDNSAPTVATPASASPNPITSTTTDLSVLGADTVLGEGSLTYSWTATVLPAGAGLPTFSANGTNAAKNTLVNFSQAGSYVFTVTITDMGGLSTTSTANVTVNQTLTSFSLSPTVANLTAAGTQQFTVAGQDQFGNAMTSQPTCSWSLIGAGSISGSGLYQPPYATGTTTVQVTSGSLTGTATVNFAGQAVWSSTVSSSWNSPGNWRDSITGAVIAAPGLRGIAGDTVVFNSSAGGAVTLNGADPSLAGITFSGGGSQSIAQGTGGALSLNNGGNVTTITVGGGSQAISAPLMLYSNLVVAPAAGSSLTVSGAISGAAQR